MPIIKRKLTLFSKINVVSLPSDDTSLRIFGFIFTILRGLLRKNIYFLNEIGELMEDENQKMNWMFS